MFIYGFAGAFVGVAWGAWTLASRGPDRGAVPTYATAPQAPACPAGYQRAAGFDSGALVENTRTRWLVRCDPVRSDSAISESLELFWSAEMVSDARAHPLAMRTFVEQISQSNRVALEPLPAPTRQDVTLRPGVTVSGLSVSARGGLRLPSMALRAWVLPAGGHTLLAVLVAPSEHREALEGPAADAVAHVEGLRAFEEPENTERGFTVRARCPSGWTDATPADGGRAQATYVGRVCIAPSRGGGGELTFVELTGQAQGPEGARRTFELAATMIAAVGTRVHTVSSDPDAGASRSSTAMQLSAPEPVRVASVDGFTAHATLEPPPAQLVLRAWMLPAGGGSVYALSTSLREREREVREALDGWVRTLPMLHGYDPAPVVAQRTKRFKIFVLIPGVMTALLGVGLAIARARSLRKADSD